MDSRRRERGFVVSMFRLHGEVVDAIPWKKIASFPSMENKKNSSPSSPSKLTTHLLLSTEIFNLLLDRFWGFFAKIPKVACSQSFRLSGMHFALMRFPVGL